MKPIAASWKLSGALDLVSNTGQARVGGADPTGFVREGRVWRASRHESGNAALALWSDGTYLRAEAWGAGAEAALQGAPAIAGLADDPRGFDPSPHRVLADAARAHPGVRLCRTEALFDAGVSAILGQKVTGVQARRSYQALVRRCGTVAPVPRVSRRPLLVPPSPVQVLRALAGHGGTTLGIDATRVATLRELALVAPHLHDLERTAATEATTVQAFLMQIPGVGEWTANHMTATALGDPNAVAVGDFHLKNIVAFALTGAPRGTDEEMVALLEPFRPHRARAVRLIGMSGIRPPRYGPRMNVPAHLPAPRP